MAKDADGVVIVRDVEPQVLEQLRRTGLPYIILDSYTADPNVFSIGVDARDYTCKAVRYLVGKGHKRIGLIGASFIPDFWQQVYDGYTKTMGELGLDWEPGWLQNTADDENTAYACMERILAGDNRPTAVFCAVDIYAIGAIRCIKNAGLKVPEDISVMGVDNIILGRYQEPALTTMDIQKEEMGRLGLDALMRRIGGENVGSIRMSNSQVVERESVAAPAD